MSDIRVRLSGCVARRSVTLLLTPEVLEVTRDLRRFFSPRP
jgi:hypothetical protein